MKIQTIFEAFEQFQLGRNSIDQLYSWIVAGLEKVCLVMVCSTAVLLSKTQICEFIILPSWVDILT